MFALNLRYLREKYHLQRRDIAALAGVNIGTVAMWEDGYDIPKRNMLIRIADYFKVSEKDLKRKDFRMMSKRLRAMPDKELSKRMEALDYAMDHIVNITDMERKAHFSTLLDMYYELEEESNARLN